MGRPKKWTDEKLAELSDKIRAYTDNEEIPTIAGFCYKHDVRKQLLYEHEPLLDSIKRMMEKKEHVLEVGGLTGEYDKTMVIFSLKQMGWRDKPKDDEDDNLQEAFKAIADKLLDGNK